MTNYKHRNDCRLCRSTQLELVLPIRPSAIGDAFVSKEQLIEPQELFPLDTYICLDCGHLQNLDVVDPEILFRNYTYRTSVSLGLVEHFKKYAQSVVDELRIPPDSLVVEIGSNDGSLLKAFKALGMKVLGVDPAKTIAETARRRRANLPEFFTSSIARNISAEQGLAKLMCANNVFAHADNITDIVIGIRSPLVWMVCSSLRCPMCPTIIDNFVFDTFIMSTFRTMLIPLERFLNSLDMTLFDVKRVATKGGSIRGFAQPLSSGKRPKTKILSQMMAEENHRGIDQPQIYRDFYKAIQERKHRVLNYLDEAVPQNKTVAAYGASTTATTLLYHFELEKRLKFIIDDNPLKNGMFSPGAHIPVYASPALYTYKPDIVIILLWQYAEAIISKNERFTQAGGKFMIPLPDMKILP